MPCRLLLMVCVVIALAEAARLPARAPVEHGQPSTVSDLLTGYVEWVHGRGTGVELIAIDLDAARHQLAHLDPAFLPSESNPSSPETRENHRRVLTAFALELAAAGSKKQAAAAARLVEWACPYVRSHAPLNDFDRAWQLAALAVLEGGIDSHALQDHLDHVQSVFPDEPRLILARAIAEEQFSAPAEVLSRSVTEADLARAKERLVRAEGERLRAAERAIARFRDASRDDSLRPEASLRLGHVQLGLGRYDAALASWADIEHLTPDPALVYLVHLFRGLAFEGRGRSADAEDSYLQALHLSPGAHSATMRLAALSFRGGRSDEPARLVASLLHDDDPTRDPWWSYYAADWRFWYPRIDRVRALLRS